MSAQLASSDEPPSDMKGVVRPVSGMTLVTPPMTTNTWSPTEKARPNASSLPKPSRTPSAVRNPRSTNTAYRASIAATPNRPSSSPKLAKMKSLLAKATSHGRPCPRPVPKSPPEAIPMMPLASWSDCSSEACEKGSSHSSTRCWTWSKTR